MNFIFTSIPTPKKTRTNFTTFKPLVQLNKFTKGKYSFLDHTCRLIKVMDDETELALEHVDTLSEALRLELGIELQQDHLRDVVARALQKRIDSFVERKLKNKSFVDLTNIFKALDDESEDH